MPQGEAATQSDRTPVWVAGLLSLAVSAAAIFWMWTLAIPLPEGTACIAIFPPPAGCAGTARMLPAIVWTVLCLIATAATFALARRGWLGATAGVALTALVAAGGYIATLYMQLFVII